MSKVPPAATAPAASALSYLYLFISGIAIRPIVRTQATLEELIAEKIPHAKMVAMAKPPGSRPSTA